MAAKKPAKNHPWKAPAEKKPDNRWLPPRRAIDFRGAKKTNRAI